MKLVRPMRDKSQNNGCVCVCLSIIFCQVPIFFFSLFLSLKFLTSIWAQSADRLPPSPMMYTLVHTQATEVPVSLQEQGRSKAWHSSAGPRRVSGQGGTWEIMSLRRSRLCSLQGQDWGIREQKRVQPTAESMLHADSADATHLQMNIQNCGISVVRAPNLLLFLRELEMCCFSIVCKITWVYKSTFFFSLRPLCLGITEMQPLVL